MNRKTREELKKELDRVIDPCNYRGEYENGRRMAFIARLLYEILKKLK